MTRQRLFTGKVDLGTGAETALAQIAAEELDFPIDRLNVVMGSTAETVNQGHSGGSRTIRYAGPQIRHAAAAGRQALLDLAAIHFKVPSNQLSVANGIISVGGASGKSISYGRLVDGKRLTMEIGASGDSYDLVVAPQAKLKDPADLQGGRHIGAPEGHSGENDRELQLYPGRQGRWDAAWPRRAAVRRAIDAAQRR